MAVLAHYEKKDHSNINIGICSKGYYMYLYILTYMYVYIYVFIYSIKFSWSFYHFKGVTGTGK